MSRAHVSQQSVRADGPDLDEHGQVVEVGLGLGGRLTSPSASSITLLLPTFPHARSPRSFSQPPPTHKVLAKKQQGPTDRLDRLSPSTAYLSPCPWSPVQNPSQLTIDRDEGECQTTELMTYPLSLPSLCDLNSRGTARLAPPPLSAPTFFLGGQVMSGVLSDPVGITGPIDRWTDLLTYLPTVYVPC